jgi:hypothetical protein
VSDRIDVNQAAEPAQAPLEVDRPDAVAWDEEVDILIVGFGAAGASAAIEAKERGFDALVIERFNGGGATAVSGGVIYSGGGTRVQKEAGIEDDVEDMVRYLETEIGDGVSPRTLRDFCETSVETFAWLEKHGLQFKASLCPKKTSYPLDKYCLYFSGNEGFLPHREKAQPAPRGHRVIGKGLADPRQVGAETRAFLQAGGCNDDSQRQARLEDAKQVRRRRCGARGNAVRTGAPRRRALDRRIHSQPRHGREVRAQLPQGHACRHPRR